MALSAQHKKDQPHLIDHLKYKRFSTIHLYLQTKAPFKPRKTNLSNPKTPHPTRFSCSDLEHCPIFKSIDIDSAHLVYCFLNQFLPRDPTSYKQSKILPSTNNLPNSFIFTDDNYVDTQCDSKYTRIYTDASKLSTQMVREKLNITLQVITTTLVVLNFLHVVQLCT